MIRVTVWNENVVEKEVEIAGKLYPNGMHNAIADFLRSDEIEVRTATLEDEECGMTEEVLNNTDVLIWWGHCRHAMVPDEIAFRVRDHVRRGMGFIALHSSHRSKPFQLLTGTSGSLCWRIDEDREILWNVNPTHPITQGIGRCFQLEHEEIYAEPFAIPKPDDLIFIGWYEGGDVFRSGCTFYRENGKIFYFQPGHEEYPTFYDPNVQTVIRNAVYWAKPVVRVDEVKCYHVEKPLAD